MTPSQFRLPGSANPVAPGVATTTPGALPGTAAPATTNPAVAGVATTSPGAPLGTASPATAGPGKSVKRGTNCFIVVTGAEMHID